MRTITCKYLSTLLLLFVAALGAACSNTEKGSSSSNGSSQNQMSGHEAAARKALEALPTLVTQDNFSAMGFGSVEEARSATLGTPTARRTVGYDKLLSYQPGTPLTQLFEGREEFIYPVLVGQEVKTSIVVAANAGGWQISSVGDRYLAEIISGARQTKSPTPSGTPAATASPTATPPKRTVELVSMPGINFDLVSFTEGDQTLLEPTRDLPEAQLIRGRAVKAEDALVAISNYAKEIDRKYGDEIRKRRLVR